jgi:hypothetical protein
MVTKAVTVCGKYISFWAVTSKSHSGFQLSFMKETKKVIQKCV